MRILLRSNRTFETEAQKELNFTILYSKQCPELEKIPNNRLENDLCQQTVES